jgi:plastocyanin
MRVRILSIAAVLVGATACGGSGSNSGGSGGGYGGSTAPANDNPAPSAPNTVNANPGLAFNPTSLTVAKGTTVTFNFGTVGHSVTFTTAGAPASIPVTSNAAVGVVFPTAGTYSYYCTQHSYMTGMIIVQ